MDEAFKENLQILDVPGLLNGAKYYRSISELMEIIHAQIPVGEFDVTKIATLTDIREEYFNGANRLRAVMYLLSNGCEWALKGAHGCTVCGHLARQTRTFDPISAESYLTQFINEFHKIDFRKYPLLNLYNNGSFLNQNEIPPTARREMLKMVRDNDFIQMVVLETRPEFAEKPEIDEIAEILSNKHVEIAVGLEVVDDFLRYVAINKGFSLKKYDQAAEVITKKLFLRTYVMLKPPLLNERESITQAIDSIKYAFKAGSATVSLETCTIQDFTLTKYLSDRNYYKTAWLWSIIEVIKQTAHLGKLVVGLFQFYPSPSKVPYNCAKCSDRVMESIREYNRTLDLTKFDGLECDCQTVWRKELDSQEEPFTKRLDALLKDLMEQKQLE